MLKNNFKETNWEAVVAVAIAIVFLTLFICGIIEAVFTLNLSNIVWMLAGVFEIALAVLVLYLIIYRK